MQQWLGVAEIPGDWDRCVVTIGVLDGVHLGHTALVRRAVAHAHRLGVPCVVLTFDRHPAVILDPDRAPVMLTSAAHKADLLAALGVDAIMTLHFTRDMSEMSPQDFVKTVLVDGLHAATVVVGENFTFGYRASGNVEQLTELGRGYGFEVEALPLVADGVLDGQHTVSATAHPSGAGRRRGRARRPSCSAIRTAPTGWSSGATSAGANSASRPRTCAADNAAVPADGVYAGRVIRLDDEGHPVHAPPLGIAAISVGTNPTFEGRDRSVEAYVLDFDGDLYGERLGVEFGTDCAGMERFDSVDELIAQMHDDVAQTRELMIRRRWIPRW